MKLSGADTNVLVRFLLKDVERQAQIVLSLLEDGQKFYINEVVLSELYWVLTKVYNYSKNSFIIVIDMMLESDGFQFFDAEIVRGALTDYIHNAAVEFSDCLIHQLNLKKKIGTYTFDKKASGLKKMHLLKS